MVKKRNLAIAGLAGIIATAPFLLPDSESDIRDVQPHAKSSQRTTRISTLDNTRYNLVDQLHEASRRGNARGIYSSLVAINTHEQNTGSPSSVGLYIEDFFDANPDLSTYSATELEFVQNVASNQATLWEERKSDRPFMHDHNTDAQIARLYSFAGQDDLASQYFEKALVGKKEGVAKRGKADLFDLAERGTYAAHTSPEATDSYFSRIQTELDKGLDLIPIDAKKLGKYVIALNNQGYESRAADIGAMLLDQTLYNARDAGPGEDPSLRTEVLDLSLTPVLKRVAQIADVPTDHESVQYLNAQ